MADASTSMTPTTLVSPLPTITPVRQGVSSEQTGALCSLNYWAAANPLLALLAAAGVYFVARSMRGGK